jgi:Dynamin central region
MPRYVNPSRFVSPLKLTTDLGVITKPDRCERSGNIDEWRRVLRGQAFKLGHGYFVTKQPSQQQLLDGISHTNARASEEAFFSSAEWSDVFPGHQNRLGTKQLQNALSEMLAKLILNW